MKIKEYMTVILMIKMVIDLNFRWIANKSLFLKMLLQKMEKIDIFEEVDELKGNKARIKPFSNLFKDLTKWSW